VKRVNLGIDARQRPLSTGVNDPEDMVVGKQVVKAEALDGETKLPNSGRIAMKLRLRVHHPNPHLPSITCGGF